MFDCLLIHITETSDSELPVVTQFISALLLPTNLYPGYIERSSRWWTKKSENLCEIMSSKEKGYRRISGLAKPLADFKTEVRF